MEIKIPQTDRVLGANWPVFLVAEIGKNFIQTKEEQSVEKYLENAKALVKAAAQAGADAVKFQTHNVEDEQMEMDITSPHFTGSDRYHWVKRNTLITPLWFWQELKNYAAELGLIFFSAAMSRGAAKILEKVDVPLWKVGSGDPLDFVLLDYLVKTNKPIIISTGMSTLAEIDLAINFLKRRNAKIVLMHCVSKYPCPVEDLNLATIKFFQKRYQLLVGFSDHSLSCDSAVAAVNLGAVVIEKHFSLKRSFWGSDHQVSLTPDEFALMVKKIRAREVIGNFDYGDEHKILQNGEAVFRPIYRKTLVAGKNLKAGTILEPEMIYAMRPQVYLKGLPSEAYEEVLGKKINQDLKKYQPITAEILK